MGARRWRPALVLASALCLSVCAVSPAMAQTESAADPDPVKVDLARQLVEATGGEAQAEQQMGLIFNMEKMVGGQFEDGLRRLKSVVEAPAQAAA